MNSKINKRLKDALFTDQWSELFMDALSPFHFVLVRRSQRDWAAGVPSACQAGGAQGGRVGLQGQRDGLLEGRTAAIQAVCGA